MSVTVAETKGLAHEKVADATAAQFLAGGGSTSPSLGSLLGRVAVLAFGCSSADLAALRNLQDEDDALPVTRAVLHDHAVVYAASCMPHGKVELTLARWPGTLTYLPVLWLSKDQLVRLHQAKGMGTICDFVALDDARLDVEDLGSLASASHYRTRAPAMHIDGRPVRFAELPCAGCTLPALSQRAMLRLLHRRLGVEDDYGVFVERLVGDDSYRERVHNDLRQLSKTSDPAEA